MSPALLLLTQVGANPMADRIFAGILLVVTLAYGFIAFTAISAPFQYDPLGPESWPQLLSVIATLCILKILWKPDTRGMGVARSTWFRLVGMVILLIIYAELYEFFGFIVMTMVFSTAVALMLGAQTWRAVAFGVSTGVFGYLLCVTLLDLNLPSGEIFENILVQTEGTN